uniref:Uncharacterized protein n=1 Tax=Arundo donax TaxID=35708 RepID=A0A0A8YI74_ARUDO
MKKDGQFTYTSTLPLTWRLPQALDVEIGVGCNFVFNCARQDSNLRL